MDGNNVTEDEIRTLLSQVREVVNNNDLAPFDERTELEDQQDRCVRNEPSRSISTAVSSSIILDKIKMHLESIGQHLQTHGPSRIQFVKSIRDQLEKVIEGIGLYRGIVNENDISVRETTKFLEGKFKELQVEYHKVRTKCRDHIELMWADMPNYNDKDYITQQDESFIETILLESLKYRDIYGGDDDELCAKINNVQRIIGSRKIPRETDGPKEDDAPDAKRKR